MKANQQALRNDDDAQVGIGTMIVFIATILVAAVAAGVLINVSGGLQSKAVATGTDATENVVTSMQIQSVYGENTGVAGDGSLENVIIYLTLGAGSEAIDLNSTVIQYLDGTVLENPSAAATEVAGSGDGDGVMESGEVWSMTFVPSAAVTESQSISIDIIPEAGNAATISFTTPDAFGSDAFVELY